MASRLMDDVRAAIRLRHYSFETEKTGMKLAIDADAKHTALFAPQRDARFESAARTNDFPERPLGADRQRTANGRGVEES